MAIDEIQSTVQGRVRVLTLNRPSKKNALTVPMYRALSAHIEEADQDPGTGAIVLQARGDSFSAGNDMDDFRERAQAAEPGSSAGLDFIEVLLGCSTPVIASVQGRAIGIGTTMLLHCDFVLADRNARFSTPFVDLGLCPEAASSLLMPLMLGFRRANELLLAGETLDAEQALDCQLISRLYEPEQLAAATHELAAKIAAKPAGSLQLSKSLLRRYWRDAIKEALELEREHFTDRLRSADCKAALDRFFSR